jgi:hypothetical protein
VTTSTELSRDVLSEFAAAVMADDYAKAHEQLAPWLQANTPPDVLRETVLSRISTAAQALATVGPLIPVDYRLHVTEWTLDDVRGPNRPLPAEVTDENFHAWACIQFVADEATGRDSWFDFWCVLCDTPQGVRIGYFELMDVDE